MPNGAVDAFDRQEFSDADFRIVDNADQSKKVAFELSGLTTATKRTYTAPDASGTLALTSDLASDFTGDSGSGGVHGLVPAPAAGDAAANKFLKASGGWAVPTVGGMTLLGTLTTTSGSSQSLTSLTLTGYLRLYLAVNAVSGNNISGLLQINSNSVSGSIGNIGSAWRGWISIDLANGAQNSTLTANGADSSATATASGLSTASTTVAVAVSAGTFDAGTIDVYGVK